MATIPKTTSTSNDAVLTSTVDHSTLPSKGIHSLPNVGNTHPLDPLSAAEIAVAVSTVRAAGKTPEVRDGMRFIEVALVEPEKHVVALADAYFFRPFQSSLVPRTRGGPLIPSKLPSRLARLIVYNKKTNETIIWVVELSEVHAVARGGRHKGKVVSSQVIPEVQPAMVTYVKRATQQTEDLFELLEICWRSSLSELSL